jgi:hypothetical protein
MQKACHAHHGGAAVGPGLPTADPAGHAHTLATARAILGEAPFAAALAEGRALSPTAAIAAATGAPGGVPGAPSACGG